MEPTNHRKLLFFVICLMIIFIIERIVACGVKPKDTPVGPPAPTVACDAGLNIGDTAELTCEGGKIVSVCTDKGMKVASNTCTTAKKPCDAVTTFDELAPVIGLNCVSCHAGFDTLAVASTKIDAMISRINIGAGAANHMPAGRADLAVKDKNLFASWKADGKLAAGDCTGTSGTPAFYDFQWTESRMFEDVNRISPANQPNIRYLLAVDQLNLNRPDAVAIAKLAANKGTNSVSGRRDIAPVSEVTAGVYRIDIDALGLNANDWKGIEQASLLQFESFTQMGISLKRVTGARLPWMFVQDFNDTALRNAAVYYRLTRAPATLQQLEVNLGVKFAADLLNFKAALIGFNGSALSPAANRLISRHDSNDGYFWTTFDTGAIVSNAQNLFKNPLPVEAGGRANLKFAAGEQLFSLPNGLMGSFLANAAGVRLNEADPAIVHDFTSNPVAPIIKNAVSCFRCHGGGLLGAVDQVRAAVSNANIGAADTQRVLSLFKPQPEINQLFAADNGRFTKALAALAIGPTAPDPISRVSDRFLGDLSLEDVAALFFFRPEEMKACINLSQVGRQEAAQLLSGGTISHDQFVQVLPALLRDCRIFQDPLQ